MGVNITHLGGNYRTLILGPSYVGALHPEQGQTSPFAEKKREKEVLLGPRSGPPPLGLSVSPS